MSLENKFDSVEQSQVKEDLNLKTTDSQPKQREFYLSQINSSAFSGIISMIGGSIPLYHAFETLPLSEGLKMCFYGTAVIFSGLLGAIIGTANPPEDYE